MVLAQKAEGAKPAPEQVSPALQLIRDVADQYANAKSYRLEVVEEETQNQELRKIWSKTYLSAAEAADGSYLFAGHDALSDSVLASDATTEWHYRALTQSYTQRAVAKDSGTTRGPVSMDDYAVVQARALKKELKQIANHLKDARFLPDDSVQIGNESVSCRVVTFTSDDIERKAPTKDRLTYTIWIDKNRNLLVKTRAVGRTFFIVGVSGMQIPFEDDRVKTYTRAEVNPTFPADFFHYTPPLGAKLVAKFDDGAADFEKLAKEMIGKPAPDLSFETLSGKSISLQSLRGKPVFLEFWATWCAPCIESIPEMIKLNDELKSTPLQWLSVDVQDDGKEANDLLMKQKAGWTNYHDAAGTTASTFHTPGVPGLVLINASGNVAYIGNELQNLRNAIAKLGPEYSRILSPGTSNAHEQH